MPRQLPWKAWAIVTTMSTIALSLLLLPACCCMRGPKVPAPEVTPARIPPIGTEPIPTPTEAAAKATTEGEMRNVDFHIDEQAMLNIHTLRGQLVPEEKGTPLNLDNKNSFVLKIDTAEIGMKSASLDRLMNAYIFGYPNPPLRQLHITMEGKQLRQEGIIHKIVDIPFTMWADVSVSSGKIRIHPTKIDICGINGLGLLKAVGMTLEKMLEMPKDHGVTAEKNDLLLDPEKILPPPKTTLTLVSVRVAGDELVQTFDAGLHLPPLHPPRPHEKNLLYFRGGTLRMGKLLFVDADMEVIDADPRDPFDFFIDRYNDQLVEGFSRNQANYGLVVYMRDFNDVGLPTQPGEMRAP
jgi:hypothetical protein